MTNFPFDLLRSSRRSIGIIVRDGKVVVRAPNSMPENKILMFLEEHEEWVCKKLAFQEAVSRRFFSVKAYETVFVCGQEKQLVLGESKDEESKMQLSLKNILHLRPWIEKNYGDFLFETTYNLAKKMGVMPSSLRVRDFKAKWGSCDANGVIKLNWRVLLLKRELQVYVIVHELCHLRFLNHSLAFWNEVEKFCPDYKLLRGELKPLAFLTDLYRK